MEYISEQEVLAFLDKKPKKNTLIYNVYSDAMLMFNQAVEGTKNHKNVLINFNEIEMFKLENIIKIIISRFDNARYDQINREISEKENKNNQYNVFEANNKSGASFKSKIEANHSYNKKFKRRMYKVRGSKKKNIFFG